MCNQEIIALCALNLSLRFKVSLAHKILAYYSRAESFFEDRGQALRAAGLSAETVNKISNPDFLRLARQELEWAAKKNVRIIPSGDENYPKRLAQCPDAPILLYVCGTFSIKDSLHYLSVVGTRDASAYGPSCCREWIAELARKDPGLVVVSGLAYGIDACAHRAALDSGLPTIAVLPNGLDHIYPAGHNSLAREIVRNGLCLTEFPSKTPNGKHNFLQRNRIIAALSDATLVVESKKNGGSLITAHLALDYNREVLAIPGRVNDLRSEGCNCLIRDNKAAMVCSADDILLQLGWESRQTEREADVGKQEKSFSSLDPLQRQIVACLRREEANTDELLSKIKVPLPELSAALSILEVAGILGCGPDKRYFVNDY